MNIKENEEAHIADLQIGPTDQGMVRLIITEGDRVLNLDFEPQEAMEIAEEIRASAARLGG